MKVERCVFFNHLKVIRCLLFVGLKYRHSKLDIRRQNYMTSEYISEKMHLLYYNLYAAEYISNQ